MRYLVMDCHLSYAVVLDEDGRFLKVANRQYTVGQTVTDVIEMQVPQAGSKKKRSRWAYSLAATAACLLLVVTSVFQIGQMPYASVYMSINPEVRIDVNRRDTVVGLEGVNADGKDLIEGYLFKKKDLDLVMDELVDRAIDMGYLHEGGQISLTLDADSNEWVITHSDTLTTHLNEHLSEKLSVTIEVIGKNTPGHQITIPTISSEGNYGESDYGAEPSTMATPTPSVFPDNSYNNSNYDDGQTDYGVPNDPEGDTLVPPTPSDDGDSDYNTPDDDNVVVNGPQPDYGTDDNPSHDDDTVNNADDDSQSDYGADDDTSDDDNTVDATDGDSQSDYGTSDNNSWSDNNIDSEDSQSDYTTSEQEDDDDEDDSSDDDDDDDD